MEKIILQYINEEIVNSPSYIVFFEQYHGEGSFAIWHKKISWYFKWREYRILVAKIDDKFVGQNCAYKTYGIVCGEVKEIWWGVDAFVLESMRGMGIGKKLQKKMHEDLPNFSSASYSTINGIIKLKCGAKELLDFGFTYYPVSCYFSVLLDLVIKRIFSRNLNLIRLRLPYFYSEINGNSVNRQKFLVTEILKERLPEYSQFIEDNLKDKHFHIVRSKEYLRWKYIDNPLIKFNALSVYNKQVLEGIVIISEPFDGTVVVTKAKIAKIYDCIVRQGADLTEKQLILIAIDYYRKRSVKLDGVMALQKLRWFPRLTYPYPNSHLLSTMDFEKLSSFYLSYIDQDMERMY